MASKLSIEGTSPVTPVHRGACVYIYTLTVLISLHSSSMGYMLSPNGWETRDRQEEYFTLLYSLSVQLRKLQLQISKLAPNNLTLSNPISTLFTRNSSYCSFQHSIILSRKIILLKFWSFSLFATLWILTLKNKSLPW
jgi:hypothetical protein